MFAFTFTLNELKLRLDGVIMKRVASLWAEVKLHKRISLKKNKKIFNKYNECFCQEMKTRSSAEHYSILSD